jgi:hypothetical protein
MHRDGQLDDSEPGAEMPAGNRYRVDQFGTQFLGDLTQIGFRKPPQIGRHIDLIEQRCPVGNMAAWLLIQGFFSSHSAVYDESCYLS